VITPPTTSTADRREQRFDPDPGQIGQLAPAHDLGMIVDKR